MKEEEKLENQLNRQCWADEPEQWMQYLDKVLPEEDKKLMDAHRVHCQACSEILVELRDFYGDSDLGLEVSLPTDQWYSQQTDKHQTSLNVEQLADSLHGPIEKLIQSTETVRITVRSIAPVIFLVLFFLSSLLFLDSLRPNNALGQLNYPEKNTSIQYLVNANDQLDPFAVAVHQGYELYNTSDRSRSARRLLEPYGVIGLFKFSNAPLNTTGF